MLVIVIGPKEVKVVQVGDEFLFLEISFFARAVKDLLEWDWIHIKGLKSHFVVYPQCSVGDIDVIAVAAVAVATVVVVVHVVGHDIALEHSTAMELLHPIDGRAATIHWKRRRQKLGVR